MQFFNAVELTGNVGKIEKSLSKSGTQYARFGLALSVYRKEQNKSDTLWFNCVAFGNVVDVLDKGKKVNIKGRFDCFESNGKQMPQIIVSEATAFAWDSGAKKEETPVVEDTSNIPF